MKTYLYNIDILGVCNLACPTCAQGNSNARLPKGMMSLDLFQRIIDKAGSETIVTGICLFNWTEPLLHPHCAQFVAETTRRGLKCHLSSNLNDIRHLEDVLRANPASLRISLSGMRQESYGVTHHKGDIGKVVANMRTLRELLYKLDCPTKVHVLFHDYRHNAAEAVEAGQFTRSLGFEFRRVEAYLTTLEFVLARWRNEAQPLQVESMLKTSLDDARRKCSTLTAEPCRLQQREITIDCAGNVHLCCGLFDPKLSMIGSYLEMPIDRIEASKGSSGVCDNCIRQGGHAYVTYLWKPKERWLNRLGNLRAIVKGFWRWPVQRPASGSRPTRRGKQHTEGQNA